MLVGSRLRCVALAAIAAAGAGCGGGDGGTPSAPPGGFTVSLSAAALSLQQGASGTMTASITRTGSFAGAVNLSAQGVPTGVTATLDPAVITAGMTSTIAVPSSARERNQWSAWIASIRAVEEDTVHIVTPRRPSLEPFSDLDPIQRMIGVQLVIHDRVTPERLVRITRLDRAVLAREMPALESCGLLVQRAGGAHQIDRFARQHFVRFLAQEGLL